MSSGRHNGLRTLALAAHGVASRRMGNGSGSAIAQASHPLLKLQRLVGNRAVESALLRRQLGIVRRDTPKESSPALVTTIILARKGEVKGESKKPGYEGKIDLTSFFMGPPGRSARRGSEKEEAEPVDLNVTKLTDKSTPILAQAAAEGDSVTSAKFEFVKADEGGALSTYMALEFEGGNITSYGHTESQGIPSDVIGMSIKPKK